MRTKPHTPCPIIVALDVDTQAEALRWVEKFREHVDIFKIGLQLFSREGLGVIHAIIKRGKRVFVDLKFHDIPRTVAQVVRGFAQPGVEFLTLHASGGQEMIKAAVESLRLLQAHNSAISTRLLAVTVLTSLDDNDLRQIGVDHSVRGQVLNLARFAHSAGMDGVVASPQEVRLLRGEFGQDFVVVTPGIRPAQGNTQDQKRVMTPAQAIQEGSNFLVMGRSLLEASDPLRVLQEVLAEVGH